MLRSLCVVTALALTSQAQAGIYKCEMPDGVMAYQNQPCPPIAVKAEETNFKLTTKPKETPPADTPTTDQSPTPTEEKSWLEQRIEQREAQKKRDQEAKDATDSAAENKIRFEKLIKEHKIDVGMTREQLIQSWGMPSEGQRTTSPDGDGEVLKFKNLRDLKGATAAVVTLKNGKVVGFTKE